MMKTTAILLLTSQALAGGILGHVTQGALRVVDDSGKPAGEFPLKHTRVDAEVSGFVARVTVTQEFHNPYTRTIEAVYVFPLPENAAVDEMTMKIGERTIRGVIKKREEARRVYERARAEGKTASLLEQERPNIFTQSVANVDPGQVVVIEIKYINTLKYDRGWYEFVFPMVVGPRYIPGAPAGKQGTGFAPDTTRVPDASRITPPVIPEGMRTGADIDVRVDVHAGVRLGQILSKQHQVSLRRTGGSSATICLHPSDVIPNKDFILRYDVSSEAPQAGVISHRSEGGGFFSLMVVPPSEPAQEEVTAKEMIFVVDNSGSMRGFPMETCKRAMKYFIANMNPDDTFQVLKFSQTASGLSPLPIPNTPGNVRKGLRYVDAMRGMGGTNMIEGVKAALSARRDPERMRMVFFMTDGYIGNERQILAAVESRLGNARIFPLGVGSSVNRYLLEKMAEFGKGWVQYVSYNEPEDGVSDAVTEFYRRIRNPVLTDIEFDWGGLAVSDVYPRVIPDLFDAQPVILHGRYSRGGEGVVTLAGRSGGRELVTRVRVELPEAHEANSAMASLWARAKVEELTDRQVRGERREIVEEITRLALEFHLLTKYTSFVAVEEVIRPGRDGRPELVVQPVEMPDGVSYEGVFGKEGGEERERKARASLAAPASVRPGRARGPRIRAETKKEAVRRPAARPRKPTASPQPPADRSEGEKMAAGTARPSEAQSRPAGRFAQPAGPVSPAEPHAEADERPAPQKRELVDAARQPKVRDLPAPRPATRHAGAAAGEKEKGQEPAKPRAGGCGAGAAVAFAILAVFRRRRNS